MSTTSFTAIKDQENYYYYLLLLNQIIKSNQLKLFALGETMN